MGVIKVSYSSIRQECYQSFSFRNETWMLSMVLIQEWDMSAIKVSHSGMRNDWYRVFDSGMRLGCYQWFWFRSETWVLSYFWFRNETWVLSMVLIQVWDMGAIKVSHLGIRHGCYRSFSFRIGHEFYHIFDSGMRHGCYQSFSFRNETWVLSYFWFRNET